MSSLTITQLTILEDLAHAYKAVKYGEALTRELEAFDRESRESASTAAPAISFYYRGKRLARAEERAREVDHGLHRLLLELGALWDARELVEKLTSDAEGGNK